MAEYCTLSSVLARVDQVRAEVVDLRRQYSDDVSRLQRQQDAHAAEFLAQQRQLTDAITSMLRFVSEHGGARSAAAPVSVNVSQDPRIVVSQKPATPPPRPGVLDQIGKVADIVRGAGQK